MFTRLSTKIILMLCVGMLLASAIGIARYGKGPAPTNYSIAGGGETDAIRRY